MDDTNVARLKVGKSVRKTVPLLDIAISILEKFEVGIFFFKWTVLIEVDEHDGKHSAAIVPLPLLSMMVINDTAMINTANSYYNTANNHRKHMQYLPVVPSPRSYCC